MQAHFNDALLIRAAVIAGRPEDAADPAHVIASIKNLHDLPEGWQPFVEQMQDTATRIDNSTTPAATAAAAADLGVSCGLCHQKHGGPKPSHDPQPPAGSSVESRMEQHIWATERLWEGLAVPSSEAWNKGAKALSTEPFPEEVLKKGSTDARTAAADFAKLVAKAPSKKTAQDRAALYAELLVTCGTCHLAVEAK
jgi:cytochrome c553